MLPLSLNDGPKHYRCDQEPRTKCVADLNTKEPVDYGTQRDCHKQEHSHVRISMPAPTNEVFIH